MSPIDSTATCTGAQRIPFTQTRLWAVLRTLSVVMVPGVAFGGQNPGPLTNITSFATPLLAADVAPPLLTAPPEPSGLSQFVQNRTVLLQMGKALFWDMQVGSDGIQSCASCHFHAGADSRTKNQVSPGINVLPYADVTFQLGGGPNYTLKASDFPLSTAQAQNDVVSSQGVFSAEPMDPDGFNVGTVKVRRVEPRNTPTTINSVFNRLLFWDGRAKEFFNGGTPFGPNPTGAYPTLRMATNRQSAWTSFDVIRNGGLDNATLASLAVGPIVSLFEMSSVQRTLVDFHFTLKNHARSINRTRPLARQRVAPNDSVLGNLSNFPGKGLADITYGKMIQKAFVSTWWNSDVTVNGSTLMEENFSLFWGLAIREYLATQRSDSGLQAGTPFDRYQAGDLTALTPQQINGLRLFVNSTANGGANCSTCHALPEFTRASVRRTAAVEQLTGGATPKNSTVPNTGFHTDYGVRLPGDDMGAGNPGTYPNPSAGNSTTNTRPNTFKAPSLRNIALTAPYMHTGRFLTLEQVVDFYNDGRNDGVTNRGPALNLTQSQKSDLVAFMRFGLTDSRVLYEKAPFDHPELFVPNGHPGDTATVQVAPDGNAVDSLVQIPAVGADGGPSISIQNIDVILGAVADPYPPTVTRPGRGSGGDSTH
jgi:cytochrome c peroxidase